MEKTAPQANGEIGGPVVSGQARQNCLAVPLRTGGEADPSDTLKGVRPTSLVWSGHPTTNGRFSFSRTSMSAVKMLRGSTIRSLCHRCSSAWEGVRLTR